MQNAFVLSVIITGYFSVSCALLELTFFETMQIVISELYVALIGSDSGLVVLEKSNLYSALFPITCRKFSILHGVPIAAASPPVKMFSFPIYRW